MDRYTQYPHDELVRMARERGINTANVNTLALQRALRRHDRFSGRNAAEGIAASYEDALRQCGLIYDEWPDVPEPAKWPSVGIVVPVYNAPEMLARCVQGLGKTKYPKAKLRIVFVDNASQDVQTLEMLKAFAPVRFNEPVGFSEAVNAGIKALPQSCAYYVLLNQDIAVTDPEWLSHLIAWMEHRPDCGACGPKLIREDGTIDNAGIEMAADDDCAERGRGTSADDERFNKYRVVPSFAGAAMCVRASVAKRLGLLDERYLFGCEDLVYGMRISADLGMTCWYVPRSVLTHTCHAIRQANPEDRKRIHDWWWQSSQMYKREWGAYCQSIGKPVRVAFILPNFHSACGGARVVGALARYLTNCGAVAEVYYRKQENDPDTDFPAFPARPLTELSQADIVVATRCDTLDDALKVRASKRYYFVQQIESCFAGDWAKTAEASYQDHRFEIITIAPHLAEELRKRGREASVLDVGFYRHLYPHVKARKAVERVLMYGQCGHKGPDNPEIANQIMSLGFKVNTVHRYAPTPDWSMEHFRPATTSEMAAVYGAHDVYVYASESDGLAMTPIEAMACGVPVVLTQFPGCEQYARGGENCMMARYRDPGHVADCVDAIREDPALRKRLIEGGLETAERYDWGNVGRQYARLLLGAPE